jgi:chloramphenicol-sensitive protein RarD
VRTSADAELERRAGADAASAGTGLACGLAAFGIWGITPIYFKAVASVPALEVLAHRIVWSLVVLAVLVVGMRRGRALRSTLADRRTLATLLLTATLVSGNWFLFIWAIAHDRILQASLGYFINPLVNVALGMLFLRERLSRPAAVAVGLATVGVGYQTVLGGELPWIALVLALSFGFYGLLRKTAAVGSMVGLAVETGLLTPVALGYMVILHQRGGLRFASGDLRLDVLLAAAGVITAIPLLLFTVAARSLTLTTIGFLQYIAPSMHLVLAVAVYGEAFTIHHAVTFAFIWTALAIFSADRIRRARRARIP